MSDSPLKNATLDWDENGQPISSQYDDVYFSKASGIDETRYVFLQQNHLEQRWQQLSAKQNGHFTIGETGFGTGLNFLAAAELWLRCAPANWRLHFVSVEKFPLNKTDLEKSLALWPELSELANELLANYPPAIPGCHRLNLCNGRIALTLLFGEAADMFEQLRATDHPLWQHHNSPVVDAWFLDGFAPSKNPDMWTPELFSAIADLSATGSTLATFTAAGIVRRGLQEVGFQIEKVAGFGHKREMVRGQMTETPLPERDEQALTPASYNSAVAAPWYITEHSQRPTDQRIAIIGGGIAGCTLANAMANRGWQVTLVERHEQLASEASGNPQGIIYPKLSKQDSVLSRFGLYSLIYASRFYSRFWDQADHPLGQRCGVMILPENDKQRADFSAIGKRFENAANFVQLLPQQQLSDISGLSIEAEHGLFCPQLGWVIPPQVCQVLSEHPNIKRIQAEVDQLQQTDAGHWQLFANGQLITESPTLVLSSSHEVSRFQQTAHLPLKRIRGQVTQLSNSQSATETARLKTVICGAGYIAPAHNGKFTLGATYDIGDTDAQVRDGDHRKNIDKLAKTDAGIGELLSNHGGSEGEQPTGRVAFRCTTPDYLPIAGPAPKAAGQQERFALLAKNARAHIPLPGDYYQGLYVNCGYGSRGLSYAPLAAELLAAQLCGEVPPIERELSVALNPARFLIRDLKRSKG